LVLADSHDESGELLRQIATVCRGIYTQGYAVDILRHQISRRKYNTGSMAAQQDRSALPMPTVNLESDGANDRIVLARSSGKMRFERKNSAGEDWDWRADGQSVICYRRDLNLYTETPADPWPERLGPGPGLPGEEWKYFAKFLAIEDMTDHAQILKDDVPPDRFCDGASTLITLILAEDQEPARELLRVLTRSHLPCHSTIIRTRVSRAGPMEQTETITWRFRPRPEPSFFVFAPHKRAKKVKGFPRSF